MTPRPPPAALPEQYAPSAPEDLHYATLYEQPAQRQRVQALFRLKELVDGVPLEVSDSGVAAVKLAWWRDEVERLASGQPRHPLTTWLLAADGRAAGTALAPYVGLLLERIQAPAPPSVEILAARLAHALEPLLAHYLSSLARERAGAGALSAPLATAQLSWELLRSGMTARSGLRLVPGSDHGREPTPADLAERLTAELEAVPRRMRRQARTPITLARITRFNLGEAGSTERLRHERPEPVPLMKLTIALRTRICG